MASQSLQPDYLAFIRRLASEQDQNHDLNLSTPQVRAPLPSQDSQQPVHSSLLRSLEATMSKTPTGDSQAPSPAAVPGTHGVGEQPSPALSSGFSTTETLLDLRPHCTTPRPSHLQPNESISPTPGHQHPSEDSEQQDSRGDYEQQHPLRGFDEEALISEWLATVDAGLNAGSVQAEGEGDNTDMLSALPQDPIFEQAPFWTPSDFRWTPQLGSTTGDQAFWVSREEFVAHFKCVQSNHMAVEKLITAVVGHYRVVDNLNPEWQQNMTLHLSEDIRNAVITAKQYDEFANIVIPALGWTPPIEQMVSHLEYLVTTISSAAPQDTPLTEDEVLLLKTACRATQLDFYQECANLTFIKVRNIVFKPADAAQLVELAEYERKELKSLNSVVFDIFNRKLWPENYEHPVLKAMAGWIHGLALRHQQLISNYYEYPKACLETLAFADTLRRKQRDSFKGPHLCESTVYLFDMATKMLGKLATDQYSLLRPGTEIPRLIARVMSQEEPDTTDEKPLEDGPEEVQQPVVGKKQTKKIKKEHATPKPKATPKRDKKRKRKGN